MHALNGPARQARRFIALAFVVLASVTTVATLSAHDFWIVPIGFEVSAGTSLEVLGQTSTTFPTTLSAVTPERVAEARLLSSSADERLSDLSVSGKSLLLRHRPTVAGQRVVAVALVTRTSRSTAAGLKRYIALEGAPELAERYDREGHFAHPDSITQQTTKYAKTIVEVGRGGPRAFSRAAGHALEFVPITEPSSIRVGDTLAIRLLFHGEPLAATHLHAGAAPEAALRDSAAIAKDWKDVALVTNEDGVARIPIDRAGLWNVRTLHAPPGSGAGHEGEVAFPAQRSQRLEKRR